MELKQWAMLTVLGLSALIGSGVLLWVLGTLDKDDKNGKDNDHDHGHGH